MLFRSPYDYIPFHWPPPSTHVHPWLEQSGGLLKLLSDMGLPSALFRQKLAHLITCPRPKRALFAERYQQVKCPLHISWVARENQIALAEASW